MANKYQAKQLDNEKMLITFTDNGVTVKHIQDIDKDIEVEKIKRKAQILAVNTVPAPKFIKDKEIIEDKSISINDKLKKVEDK